MCGNRGSRPLDAQTQWRSRPWARRSSSSRPNPDRQAQRLARRHEGARLLALRSCGDRPRRHRGGPRRRGDRRCTQAGEQGSNVTRNAWPAASASVSPPRAPRSMRCGSAQQANPCCRSSPGRRRHHDRLWRGGDVAGAARRQRDQRPRPLQERRLPLQDPPNGQFSGRAHRRQAASRRTRRVGFHSQRKAKVAWDEARFEQVAPIEAPVIGDDGQPTGRRRRCRATRDCGHDDGRAGEAQAVYEARSTPRARRHRSLTAPRQ